MRGKAPTPAKLDNERNQHSDYARTPCEEYAVTQSACCMPCQARRRTVRCHLPARLDQEQAQRGGEAEGLFNPGSAGRLSAQGREPRRQDDRIRRCRRISPPADPTGIAGRPLSYVAEIT